MAWKLVTRHTIPDREANNILAKYFSSLDYTAVSDNRFCVADGITRDYINGELLHSPRSISDFWYLFWTLYPLLKTKKVSQMVCNEFVDDSTEKLDILINKINNYIKKMNSNHKIDYLGHDYYACVAAGGLIEADRLIGFNIGDSNIMLLNKHQDKMFLTEDVYTDTFNARVNTITNQLTEKELSVGWDKPHVRRKFREEFRNRPDAIYDGQCLSYGALTGEEGALPFVRYYEEPLEDAHYILCFTDGYMPYLKDEEKRSKIIESYCKNNKPNFDSDGVNSEDYQKEKSLILLQRH